MQSRGFKGLMSHLEEMYDDIDDDVDEILKNNAIEGIGIAVSNAKKVMNKGYWTGNLARSIEVKKWENYTIVLFLPPITAASLNLVHDTWKRHHLCFQLIKH